MSKFVHTTIFGVIPFCENGFQEIGKIQPKAYTLMKHKKLIQFSNVWKIEIHTLLYFLKELYCKGKEMGKKLKLLAAGNFTLQNPYFNDIRQVYNLCMAKGSA